MYVDFQQICNFGKFITINCWNITKKIMRNCQLDPIQWQNDSRLIVAESVLMLQSSFVDGSRVQMVTDHKYQHVFTIIRGILFWKNGVTSHLKSPKIWRIYTRVC